MRMPLMQSLIHIVDRIFNAQWFSIHFSFSSVLVPISFLLVIFLVLLHHFYYWIASRNTGLMPTVFFISVSLNHFALF